MLIKTLLAIIIISVICLTVGLMSVMYLMITKLIDSSEKCKEIEYDKQEEETEHPVIDTSSLHSDTVVFVLAYNIMKQKTTFSFTDIIKHINIRTGKRINYLTTYFNPNKPYDLDNFIFNFFKDKKESLYGDIHTVIITNKDTKDYNGAFSHLACKIESDESKDNDLIINHLMSIDFNN